MAGDLSLSHLALMPNVVAGMELLLAGDHRRQGRMGRGRTQKNFRRTNTSAARTASLYLFLSSNSNWATSTHAWRGSYTHALRHAGSCTDAPMSHSLTLRLAHTTRSNVIATATPSARRGLPGDSLTTHTRTHTHTHAPPRTRAHTHARARHGLTRRGHRTHTRAPLLTRPSRGLLPVSIAIAIVSATTTSCQHSPLLSIGKLQGGRSTPRRFVPYGRSGPEIPFLSSHIAAALHRADGSSPLCFRRRPSQVAQLVVADHVHLPR